MLSKEASSTIFWVFGMSWPGIEVSSPRPLANTLAIRPIYCAIITTHLSTYVRDGQAKAGRPARTYTQQLCVDTVYSPEDLPETMNNRE